MNRLPMCITSFAALIVLVAQPIVLFAGTRAVIVTVLVATGDKSAKEVEKALRSIAASRKAATQHQCLDIRIHNISTNDEAKKLFDSIVAYSHIKTPKTPLIYCCHKTINGYDSPAILNDQLKALLKVDFYSEPDCPACLHLPNLKRDLQDKYPALDVQIHNVVSDREANSRLHQLANAHGYSEITLTVPAYSLCNDFTTGNPDAEAPQRLDTILKDSTSPE